MTLLILFPPTVITQIDLRKAQKIFFCRWDRPAPEERPILPGEPIKDLCAVGLLGPGGEPGWRESIG